MICLERVIIHFLIFINYETNFMSIDIKVWMLTGDKMETAENIAKSCRLIMSEMAVFHVNKKS